MKSASIFSFVFLATVWPLLLFLVGCSAEAPPVEVERDTWSWMPITDGRLPIDRVVDYWTIEHGSPRPACVATLAGINAEYVADPQALCGEHTAGCARDGWHNYIGEAWKTSDDLKVHELAHLMYACHFGDGLGDPNHDDTVWIHIPVEWSTR